MSVYLKETKQVMIECRNLNVVVGAFNLNEITNAKQVADCSFDGLELPGNFREGKKALVRGAIKEAVSLAAVGTKLSPEDGEVNGG